MQARWGNQYLQKTFFSSGGIPVLSAGMNTPFVFVRDQSLLTILKDSYLHPSLLILLAILISLLTFFRLIPSWAPPVPEKLKRLAGWFIGSSYTGEVEEEQIVFVEEDLEQTTEELPCGPPAWAEQVFQQESIKKPERLRIEFKRVDLGTGKDFYVKVHFPPIKILGFRLPEGTEFAFPAFTIPNPVLLILAVLLAIAAQIMVYSSNSLAGMVLYLLSMAGLIIWIRINSKWTNVFGNQWRISPRAEKLFLGVLLAVTAFIRYYDLSYRVYGLDIDEIRWTLQSWYSTILMLVKGDFISQYTSMPVGFWIRSVFLRLFGLNFISARVEICHS